MRRIATSSLVMGCLLSLKGGEGGPRRVWTLTLAALLLTLLFPHPAQAVPKVLVILSSGYTLEDVRQGEQLDQFQGIGRQGSATLVLPVADGEPSDPAVFLSVGAGIPMSAPRNSGPRFLEGNVERTVADVAADMFSCVGSEGDVVCRAYRRRFGSYPPLNAAAVHVGLPALLRSQRPEQAKRLGALGEILHRNKLSVGLYGTWQSGLIGMDSKGVVLEGQFKQPRPDRVRSLLAQHDLMIITVETVSSFRLYARVAEVLAKDGTANILVGCITPPYHYSHWPTPGFLFAMGPAFAQGTLLTSPSTHTAGLISTTDIGPTILNLLGVSESFGGQGKPAIVEPAGEGGWISISRLNDQMVATDKARDSVFMVHGILAFFAPLITLLGIALAVPSIVTIGKFMVRSAAASPIAFLLAGIVAPGRVGEFVAATIGICVLAAFGTSLLERWRGSAPLLTLLGITALLATVDAATGGGLASRSVLGGYPGTLLFLWFTGALIYVLVEARVESFAAPPSQEED